MSTILIFWTIVAATPNSPGTTAHNYYDWRPLGEFRTPADCEKAAAQLAIKNFRCINNGKAL